MLRRVIKLTSIDFLYICNVIHDVADVGNFVALTVYFLNILVSLCIPSLHILYLIPIIIISYF